MRLIHFDSVGGASGDMVLGALIGLGADLQVVSDWLRKLPIEAFQIKTDAFESHGLNGLQLHVEISEAQPHRHEHHHHHSYRDIREMLEASDLPERGKTWALDVFYRIAVAEGEVHSKPVEEVHFHEIGAMDSIIDIVGSCLALDLLNVDSVSAGPLPLGSGTLTCAHGTYPVPAPATLKLLADHPVIQSGEQGEMVTPTGAALLTTWSTSITAPGPHRITSSSYSFGHRTFPARPNVLRASLLETQDDESDSGSCMVLESNIDDCNPELLGCLAEKLYEAGALEVFLTPVQMKKFRQGTLLSVLCASSQVDLMLNLIFRESTTFGIRYYEVQRACLSSKIIPADTPYGSIPVKVGSWKGETLTASPEMDACKAAAAEKHIAIRDVYQAASAWITSS